VLDGDPVSFFFNGTNSRFWKKIPFTGNRVFGVMPLFYEIITSTFLASDRNARIPSKADGFDY